MIFICHKPHHATLYFNGASPSKDIVGVGHRATLIAASAGTCTLRSASDEAITLVIAQASFDTCWKQVPGTHTENAMQRQPSRRGRGKHKERRDVVE